MKYLVLSVSGGYWYRADYIPQGAIDIYCATVDDVVAAINKEDVNFPHPDDMVWLTNYGI